MSDNQPSTTRNPPQNLTLQEEYQILCSGGRLKSSRSATQTVQERDKKLQLEQLQQLHARKRERARKNQAKKQQQGGRSTGAGRQQTSQTRAGVQQRKLHKLPPVPSQPSALPPAVSKFESQSPIETASFHQPQVEQAAFSQSSHAPPSRQSPWKSRTSLVHHKEIQEQIGEFKVLDKVLPCFDLCAGLFVQVGVNSFSQVSRVTGNTVFTVDAAPSELSAAKFLMGAFWCEISEIDFTRVADRFGPDFDIRDTQSNKHIVLIQTISQQSALGEGDTAGSIHRLHALGEVDENKFILHPASFKNNSNFLKKLQRQRLDSLLGADEEEKVDYVYKSDGQTERILNFAMQIQTAYSDYRSKVSSVPLNQENAAQNLFSFCKVTDNQHEYFGVLTQVHKQNVLLRLLRSSPEDSLPQKWFDLQTATVQADLTMGFVAKSTLAQSSLLDLKLRSIKFISKRESDAQNQLCSVAPQPIRSKNECHDCKYFLQETGDQQDQSLNSVKTLVCFDCQNPYHEQHFQPHQKRRQPNGSWTCPHCTRCVNCKAHSSQLLVCGVCNEAVHDACIDPDYQSQIDTGELVTAQHFNQINLTEPSKFRCKACLECTACGCKNQDVGQRWSRDFKLCQACDKKRDEKMYCGGCLKFIGEDEQAGLEMIRCNSCRIWVHKTCDRMLEDEANLAKFSHCGLDPQQTQLTILYSCVCCRQKSRANFIEQIVDQMMLEDKKSEFYYPFWKAPNNAHYLKVIKKPICFQMIHDELRNFDPDYGHQSSKLQEFRYLCFPEEFKQAVDLIFRNAQRFNPFESEIYNQAERMHLKCTQILNQGRIWEIFNLNSKTTLDELQNLKFLRGFVSEPVYALKPRDLFSMYEQLDVRQYQYLLQSNVQLGKRTRDTQLGNQSLKRQRTSETGEQQQSTPFVEELQILPQDCKKMMQEANKRVILQNLGNLLKNLHSKQQSTNIRFDKSALLNQQQFEDLACKQQLSPKSRWRHLMDELRSSDEQDSCWYSSPVRVSFNDPSLIFEEMCYLCGAFGLRDDFLTCNFCAESFHPYCLPQPKESKAGIQEHWFCYNCVFCEKCHSSKQWEFLVLCSVCEKAAHYQCLEPQLIVVPECNWKCSDCFKCRTCGSKEFFSAEDIENRINLNHNEKYVLSFDFEFCYQCGQDQFRKSQCNICKQKTGLGLEPLQLQKKNFYAQVPLTSQGECEAQNLYKCVKCKYYTHLSCSRTTLEALNYLREQAGYTGFQCIDCLLADKQPGFYLHEQCALYSDMHERAMEFQTLKILCDQVLSRYTDNQLIISEYVRQNQATFWADTLIRKWVDLLRTDVDFENSTGHGQSIDEQANVPPIQEDIDDIEMKVDSPSHFEIVTNTARKPRDLYVNLYLKENQESKSIGEIPEIQYNQAWLQPNLIDYDQLLAAVEYRAIWKIRTHFIDWASNSLVGQAIDKIQLFQQPLLKNEPDSNRDVGMPLALPAELSQVPEPVSEQVTKMCTTPDETIMNPQIKLTCILCQQSGEKRITGRLIPFQVNQFVHVNCAMWTTEVHEGTEDEGTVVSSELYNFFFAFKQFRNNRCSICDLKGATLTCANHSANRKCLQPFYHFPCAYSSGKVSFQNTIEIFCPACAKRESDIVIGLPIKFRDYHRRRFLIVKNIQPQCTSAFNAGHVATEQADMSQNQQPQQYYNVNCNKWRPYYYDMFNRAGNLTILSLSHSANSIIESLHNITHQQTDWHQRNKQKDLLEKHSDFASLRIFWKEGSTKEKGYYLFNESRVTKLPRPVFECIASSVQKFIKMSVPNMHVKQSETKSADTQPMDQFWQSQIGYLRSRYCFFNQDSTYLTPQLLSGQEKYPIQFWNNPKQKVGLPLKEMSVVNFFYKSAERAIQTQQLYTQKTQAEPSITPTEQQQNQALVCGGLHSVFSQILKANKFVDKNGFTHEEISNIHNPKYVATNPTELEIKQILGSLDKTQSVFNQQSSRNMTYEQIMGGLGKKTMNQRKIIREARKKILNDSDDEALTAKQQPSVSNNDLDVGKQSSEVSSLWVICLQVVKGNEINLAMKYRASRDRPKAVEVCTSKIHRNGLFACQPFQPKDIVIEYVGEKIRIPVADKREKIYDSLGLDMYLFSLDADYIIDATFYGNKARYINHSCDPNLKSDKLVVNGETHIIFQAIRYIECGEELTFDYKIEDNGEDLECFCGSEKCRKRLN